MTLQGVAARGWVPEDELGDSLKLAGGRHPGRPRLCFGNQEGAGDRSGAGRESEERNIQRPVMNY